MKKGAEKKTRRIAVWTLLFCLFVTGCAIFRGHDDSDEIYEALSTESAGAFPAALSDMAEVGIAPGDGIDSDSGSSSGADGAVSENPAEVGIGPSGSIVPSGGMGPEAGDSSPGVIYSWEEGGNTFSDTDSDTVTTDEAPPAETKDYVFSSREEDLSLLNSGTTGSDLTETAASAAGTATYETTEHVSWFSCLIDGENIVLSGESDGLLPPDAPMDGEAGYYYLLELQPFEDSVAGHSMIAMEKKSEVVSFSVPLNEGGSGDRLYNKFVVSIWENDHFTAISDYVYITNPEVLSKVTKAYQEPLSKKGLLIEINEISDAFSLGVMNVIINIPFDTLIGEGIDYTYDGETYHFSSTAVESYDHTISMFSNKSMNVHVILLNRYNERDSELFYPDVSGAEKNVMYYNFNASTEEGFKRLKAIASFLASRYSGTDPDHGLVQNWIIGNEINNQLWNYVGPMDLSDYAREYVRCFRVFYNAMKSEFAEARIYFSLDNNWNRENDDSLTYTARDTLLSIADEISSHGNIDWGLGYHPYPVPSFEPEFWDDFDTGLCDWSYDSPVVNFANLSVLTDFMQQANLLDNSGSVRHIVLSEQGFTSESATRGTVEELQAAAFAYAYYIVDSDPYIDAFILSRQIDAPSEVSSSLAFGLWTTDSLEDVNITKKNKKYIWNVFKNIDKKATTLEYSAFALDILGAEKWQDIIPNFKWRKYE